jgi:hypothetical protein
MANRQDDTHPIVFFEKTPFMSVELVDLLKNFSVVCYDDDAPYASLQRSWPVYSYGNTALDGDLDSDVAVETMLEDRNTLGQLLPSGSRIRGLFFYMNPRIAALSHCAGLTTALPPYRVQEALGNKLNLSRLCKEVSVPCPPTLAVDGTETVSDIMDACIATVGWPVVLQGPNGVSGEDTFCATSPAELEQIVKRFSAPFRATRYIERHIPISVHVCVLADDIIVRGPYLQIVGFPALSPNPFQFSGNDTNQALFDDALVGYTKEMSERLAEGARRMGYLGILGIDYLWDRDTNEIHPQEINSRLVGLTRLLTGAQKDQGLYPDVLKHLEAFGLAGNVRQDLGYRVDDVNLDQGDYSQIIISNNSDTVVEIGTYVRPGIYDYEAGRMVSVSTSLFVKEMRQEEVLVAAAPCRGRRVPPGGTLAKIILKRSVIENREYALTSWCASFIEDYKRCVLD